ncbi:carboxypeptidase regulatory-like domain-containing protein [Candidatus Palauibacter sp.]|uniref:carboxypeptidase regulatory-like domain-containing protein n=1 Tax=Candidatus Palauibacter sp. TaxID=3101350 RepID=UPI003B526B3A
MGVTEDPVAAAAVSVPGRTMPVETNGPGRFVLDGLAVGEHELHVRYPGYAPLRHRVTVDGGLTTDVEIGLVSTSVEVEPRAATATRLRRLEVKGFCERRLWGELLGTGTFLPADLIERRRPSGVSRFIADHMLEIRRSGVRLVNAAEHMGLKGCPMAVCVDGILLCGYGIDGAVLSNHIAGFEVYNGLAGLPVELRDRRNRCGASVAWTKWPSSREPGQ